MSCRRLGIRSLRSEEKRQRDNLGSSLHPYPSSIDTNLFHIYIYIYHPPNYILSSVSSSLLTFLLRSPQQGFSFQFCSIEKKNWKKFSPQKIVLLIQFTLETRNFQNFPKFLDKKFRKINPLVPSLNKFLISNARQKGDQSLHLQVKLYVLCQSIHDIQSTT